MCAQPSGLFATPWTVACQAPLSMTPAWKYQGVVSDPSSVALEPVWILNVRRQEMGSPLAFHFHPLPLTLLAAKGCHGCSVLTLTTGDFRRYSACRAALSSVSLGGATRPCRVHCFTELRSFSPALPKLQRFSF